MRLIAWLVLVVLLIPPEIRPVPVNAAAASDSNGADAYRVDVGGHKLYVTCMGSGSPTVILSARFVERWERVQPGLAQYRRTCAYDRAGNGMSGSGPVPTTVEDLATDLHRLLVNGKIPGPYILVGEGFDGNAMELYAAKYRHSTAGLVLVDAIPVQDFRIGDVQLFGIQSIAVQTSRTEMLQVRSLGDLPLVVISHGVYLSFSQRIERTWRTLQANLTSLSSDSVHVIARRSGYGIPYGQPEIVVEAVVQILLTERSHLPLRPCGVWLPSAGAGCPSH